MDKESLLNLYRQMVLIRTFEDKTAEMYGSAKIRGFLHLYNGQEAIAVGALSALNPDDDLLTHYRDHGYALVRGIDPKLIMAELYGRVTGTAAGRGGSMHLSDVSKRYWGGYAIVGGHLPMAAGLAYAAQYHKTGRVVLCVTGDGSTNIGTFHAALNWAKLWNLPVIFMVENNHFAMGTAYENHSAVPNIIDKADGFKMAAEQFDGNDVMAVREAVCRAADRARGGGGPTLLEAVTYRFRGHSMADSDVQRNKADIAKAKEGDPIIRFERMLIENKHATPADFERALKDAEAIVAESVEFAEKSPEPGLDTMYDQIYTQPVPNMQVGGSLIRPAKVASGSNGTH